MCKLCNTSRPPHNISSSVNPERYRWRQYKSSISIKREKDLIILYEYIQDFPCKDCLDLLRNASNQYKKSIDEWILQRLIAVYTKSKDRRKYKDKIIKKGKYKKLINIETSIFTNNKSFIVKFNRSTFSCTRMFKTLEEAQQFKKEILCQTQQVV